MFRITGRAAVIAGVSLVLGLGARSAALAPSRVHADEIGAPVETLTAFTTGNEINDLAIDPNTGDVWAATRGGVVRWQPELGAYTKYTVIDGLLDGVVLALAIDPQTGDKWFGTNIGISRLSAGGGWDIPLAGFKAWSIVFSDKPRTVWVGTGGGGLLRRNLENGQDRWYTIADGLPSNEINAVIRNDVTGALWIGTNAGACQLVESGCQQRVYFPGRDVLSGAVDSDTGDTWFGTKTKPDSLLAGGLRKVERDGSAPPSPSIPKNSRVDPEFAPYVAFQGSTGALWASCKLNATGMGCLARLGADGQWTTFVADGQDMVAGAIHALEFDPATGAMWIGSHPDAGQAPRARSSEARTGINRVDVDDGWAVYRTDDALLGNSVRGVAVSPATFDVWVATQGGLSRLLPRGAWKTYSVNDGSLGTSDIRDVAVDPRTHDVWVATWQDGVHQYTADGRWIAHEPGGEFVRIAINGQTGEKWVGGLQTVLRIAADGRKESFGLPGMTGDYLVSGIAVDVKTGDVWFSAFNCGACAPNSNTTVFKRGKDGQWRRLPKEPGGLPSESTNQITVDDSTGDIWFATAAGAARLTGEGTGEERWTVYTKADGLGDNDVADIAIDQASHTVWFATRAGLSRLSPSGEWRSWAPRHGLPNRNGQSLAIDPSNGDVWLGTEGGLARVSRNIAGDRCSAALQIRSGTDTTDRLESAGDSNFYSFVVSQPFSKVEVNVTDRDDLLNVDIYRACDGNIGIGTGRHIGIGTGRHIGGRQQRIFDTKAETGRYYIAISPKPASGSFPIDFTLHLGITSDPTSTRTLILTDEQHIAELAGLDPLDQEMVDWRQSLDQLAAHSAVAGRVVYDFGNAIETSPEVQLAYSAWRLHPTDPAQANAVAEAIRDWIWSRRASLPRLQYVVLVGDDRVIPHLRVPIVGTGRGDDGWLTEDAYIQAPRSGIDPASAIASALGADFTLSDDIYGARQATDWQAARSGGLPIQFHLPELAVGRLVERPRDMTALIDTFLASGGELPIDHSLVVGYDFMQDAPAAADDLLAAAALAGDVRTRLFENDLTAGALGDALFNKGPDLRPDLALFAVHADHDSFALPQDGLFSASDLVARSQSESPLIAYALACHGGLSLPGTEHGRSLDFPEAWQRGRGGVYIGATGWSYGLERTLAYGEALMVEFVRALTTGPTTVGDALVQAKSRYDLEHISHPMHQKTLAGTLLYGLPMTRVRIEPAPTAPLSHGESAHRPHRDAARDKHDEVRDWARGIRWTLPAAGADPLAAAWSIEPDAVARLAALREPIQVTVPFSPDSLRLRRVIEGEYFTYSDNRPRDEAGEPFQPMWRWELVGPELDGQAYDVRGAVLTGATLREQDIYRNFQPLVLPAGVLGRRPDALTQSVVSFDEPGWYPRVPFSLRRLDQSPGIGGEQGGRRPAVLNFTVGQYHAASRTERLFDTATVELYYSASADRAGPEIELAASSVQAGRETLALGATDSSGVVRVTVAYTIGDEPWHSVDFAHDSTVDRWTGVIPASATYLVQVVDGAGNVTTLDDTGAIDRPCVGCQERPSWLYLPVIQHE